MESVKPLWTIMPVMAAPDLTMAAIADILAQSIPTKLLIVNQGVDDSFRHQLERLAEEYPDRILVWHHVPPLLSLSATWNRALQFVWEVGGTEAWVVNNDVRVHPLTAINLLDQIRRYDALFVTAVGVTDEQFSAFQALREPHEVSEVVWDVPGECLSKGGPDFSNFLISKDGHERYPFDENFIPAFLEDLDSHRRYMLGGDGDRIFSINLPYLHVGAGSNTLKSMTPEKRVAHERRISQGSRAYYEKKWGGPCNQERFTIPFDPSTDQDGVTTPELQRTLQEPVDVSTS